MTITWKEAIQYGGMILAAGIWLGTLEYRVRYLEQLQQYSHGNLTPYMAPPTDRP